MRRMLVMTDNEYLIDRLRDLISAKNLDRRYSLGFAFSFNNSSFVKKFAGNDWIRPLNIKDETDDLIVRYDVILSAHCKQLFPAKLVNAVRCINVHPGFNPYNRGWFPQVFSIINGYPCGATIHVMDEHLDHGPIIAQKHVKLESWDTSYTAYMKILHAEIELLDEYLIPIIEDDFKVTMPAEGNINQKKDFNSLLKIDLANMDTFQNHINMLRALSHKDYLNSYFIDEAGNKVFLKLELIKAGN